MVQYFLAGMGALRLTAPGSGEPQAPPGYAVDEPRNSLAKNASAASGPIAWQPAWGCNRISVGAVQPNRRRGMGGSGKRPSLEFQ
jgi:hypothetical protein